MTSKGWRAMWTTDPERESIEFMTWGAHYDRADAERQAIDLKKDHPNEDWYVCEVRPVGEVVEPRPAYEVREVYILPSVRPGSEAAESLMSDEEVASRTMTENLEDSRP